MSAVVTTVILVALSLAAVVMVWGVVQGIINDATRDIESCSDVFGKIEINKRFTCYNATSNELRLNMELSDIEVNKLIVSFTGQGGEGGSMELMDGLKKPYLREYSGNYSEEVKLPQKYGKTTYVLNISDSNAPISSNPSKIEVSAEIKGKNCGKLDDVYSIEYCSLLD